jgi:hypothetical protein
MGIAFCVFGFLACFLMGRLAPVAGLGAVLTVGYLFGILRANYLDTATYFVFDSAVLGFYLSYLGGLPPGARNPACRPVQGWLLALVGWPVVMFLIPMQHPLIQVVGLRGNAFLLPFILIGCWLQRRDYLRLAIWLAALNMMALAFALAEFFLGVPTFYPRNPVTELIYRSNDVAGSTAMRIPGTFSNAHSYAGMMVSTLPWILGAVVQPRHSLVLRLFLLAGVLAGVLGMFLSATRISLGVLAILVLVATFSQELKGAYRFSWLVLLALVGYVVSGEERMQRFLTLSDTDKMLDRIDGSVNMNFIEVLFNYPIGNGMGAGGTSIPYFLQDLLTDPFTIENEYARIVLEQGFVGLLLWLAFIAWLLSRPAPRPRSSWILCRRLLWFSSAVGFVLGCLGTGMLTAIPQTPVFLLSFGMLAIYRGDPIRRRPPRPPRPVSTIETPVALGV